MNEKLKMALSDENLWFPDYTKVSEKAEMPRTTAEYQIKQARKKGELKVKIKLSTERS